jgi:hypothetical protein
MKIAPLEKTLELDGAVFRYRIPWGAKQAYIALAHGAQSEVSPEARRMIADAQREGRELTPEEVSEVGGDSVVDVAKAVDIFFSHRCLTGWDGVVVVDAEGNEKPLPFSHENAKEYLPGEAIVALAMDALMRIVESSGN